jgi:hypothetical protein
MMATISEVVVEVSSIAATLEDGPIFYMGGNVAEGIVAMQQAAEAFQAAKNDADRLDTALWVGDAYMLFSRDLPDTGYSEHTTCWMTALQISKLLGGPVIWEKRCRQEYGP